MPLTSLLAIAVGDGNGQEDAADFATMQLGVPEAGDPDPAAPVAGPGLGPIGGAAPLMVQLARRLKTVCEADTELMEACAVDGKTMRASDRDIPRTHIVSARQNGSLVFGQMVVPDKPGKLTAIRQLLPHLELEGRGHVHRCPDLCQTDIAKTIANRGYLLVVKDNQLNRHAHQRRDFAYLDYGCARWWPTTPPDWTRS